MEAFYNFKNWTQEEREIAEELVTDIQQLSSLTLQDIGDELNQQNPNTNRRIIALRRYKEMCVLKEWYENWCSNILCDTVEADLNEDSWEEAVERFATINNTRITRRRTTRTTEQPIPPTIQVAQPEIQQTQPNQPNQPVQTCLLYTSPSPRDGATSRMPSSA